MPGATPLSFYKGVAPGIFPLKNRLACVGVECRIWLNEVDWNDHPERVSVRNCGRSGTSQYSKDSDCGALTTAMEGGTTEMEGVMAERPALWSELVGLELVPGRAVVFPGREIVFPEGRLLPPTVEGYARLQSNRWR